MDYKSIAGGAQRTSLTHRGGAPIESMMGPHASGWQTPFWLGLSPLYNIYTVNSNEQINIIIQKRN